MISSDFRTEARRRLSEKWGKAVCITLAYIVIFFVINFIEGLFPDSMVTISFYKFVSGNTSNVEPTVITENNDNPIQGK